MYAKHVCVCPLPGGAYYPPLRELCSVVELINKFVVLVRLRQHSALLTESGVPLLMGKGCVHSAIDWNVKAFHPARMTPFARGCFFVVYLRWASQIQHTGVDTLVELLQNVTDRFNRARGFCLEGLPDFSIVCAFISAELTHVLLYH